MIRQLLQKYTTTDPDLLSSGLYNDNQFYAAFLKDLAKSQSEVIIESPFVTVKRVKLMLPIFEKLKTRRVKVVINTREPQRHDSYMRSEAERALPMLQAIGIQVIYTQNHHRKVAVLDRNILWEGSLNILSQSDSREMMRRIVSSTLAWQMVRFTKLDSLMN